MDILKNLTVVEGLDKSGKTTFTKHLHENLLKRNIKSILTTEPTNSQIGTFIRQNIKHNTNFDNKTLALLFSADRNEHVRYIKSLDINTSVICDRYLFSSLAYQGVDCGYDFIKKINDYPLPKLMFFIDTDIDIINSRLNNTNEKDYFENIEYLNKVDKNYKNIIDEYKDAVDIVTIKNNKYDIDSIIDKYYHIKK